MQQFTDVSPATLSRDVPLAPLEAFFWRVHEEFDGDGMGAVTGWIEGCIEEAPLEAALAALQRRHPKLRSGIVQAEDGSPYFHPYECSPRIPLEVIEFEDELPRWQDQVYGALRVKIAVEAGPLAHVIVQRSRPRNRSRITIVVHHLLYDGASLDRLVDDLFRFYEKAEAGSGLRDVESLDLISIPRAKHKYKLWLRLAQFFWLRLRRHWTTIPQADSPSTTPQYAKHVFTKGQTRGLVRMCRRENTTLYGVFFAVAASILVDLLAQKTVRLRCRFPIDVRKSLDGPHGVPTHHDLGVFVSGRDRVYRVRQEDSFWDLSRLAHRDLTNFVDAGGPLLAYNLAQFLRFMKLRRGGKSIKRVSLQVSHLGMTAMRERYGSLKLTDFFALPKTDTVGPSIVVSGSILGQRLTWGVVAANLPDDFWQRFQTESVRILERAIEGGSQ